MLQLQKLIFKVKVSLMLTQKLIYALELLTSQQMGAKKIKSIMIVIIKESSVNLDIND